MFLMTSSSTSKFLASAFDSAFLSKRVMNLMDFSGQRPKAKDEARNQYLRSQARTLGCLELLCLPCASNTASESSEGNHTVVVTNIGEVCVRLLELQA